MVERAKMMNTLIMEKRKQETSISVDNASKPSMKNSKTSSP
jgi:hypothetical protein